MSRQFNIVQNDSKELPNNIEAEQSVIGSVLVSNEIFDEINMMVASKNFYDPMHQKIFAAIEKLIYSGMLANPITLKNHFENEKDEINIPEYLVKITKFSTSSRQTIEYSKLIYALKNHGRSSKGIFKHKIIGYNFMFTEMQAAIGNVQVKKLKKIF